jgi:hypothetical protein
MAGRYDWTPGRSSLARRPLSAGIRTTHTAAMPTPRRFSLGETAITTALLSIYLSTRGTALAIAAVQTVYSADS